jgi:glycosyltransferase involved in cell wall biosynthesis
MKNHINKIAIIGLNRQLSEERVINEINIFKNKYLIDEYGLGQSGFSNNFFFIKRPNVFIRRFFIIIGVFFPRMRIYFQKIFYKNLFKFIKKEKYKFIILHNIEEALLFHNSGIPFIFHSNEYLPRQFDGDLLFRLTEIRYRNIGIKIILNSCFMIIVEGKTVAKQYSQIYNIPINKFLVIHSYQPFRSFETLFNNSSISVNEPIKLIHHGLLAPIRGIDLLIEIINKLDSNYHLTLMGPGDKKYIQYLRELSKVNNKLEILDPVANNLVVETISKFDLGLIVFGSHHFHHKYMTVPNKFWQCLQARIPVLVSQESAMAEIINENKCGIVARSSSVSDCVEAIKSLSKDILLQKKHQCNTSAWSNSINGYLEEYQFYIEEKYREID